MSNVPISSSEAPEAVGPYSQAVQAGDLVFTSGQIGLDPATGELVGGGIEKQAERAIQNLQAVLGAAGLGFQNVVKATLYLTDISSYAQINEIYGKYFVSKPARSTVGVPSLPKGALIEIDCIARGD